jgi:hypothetical protein
MIAGGCGGAVGKRCAIDCHGRDELKSGEAANKMASGPAERLWQNVLSGAFCRDPPETDGEFFAMAQEKEDLVLTGYITVVQEERFRIVTDDGRGFLLTLARGADSSAAELEQLRNAHVRVRVSASGNPNTASGLAHDIEMIQTNGHPGNQ